jgi:hypothetical protein
MRCERRCAVAVEREHVVAARRSVTKYEYPAAFLGAEVDEFVTRAAQEAGEIEVPRPIRCFPPRRVAPIMFS